LTHVEHCLAGALNVQRGGILPGEISFKRRWITLKLLPSARYAALYGGCFVE
jgi:hypothetical protein